MGVSPLVGELVQRLKASRGRLDDAGRVPRPDAPRMEDFLKAVDGKATTIPDGLDLALGSETTLRAQLGKALNHLNQQSGGGVFVASADLLGSTSINAAAEGFPQGYYNAKTNPDARVLSLGGICEDAMSGIIAGLSTYGRHVGAGSSYGAFLAPLGHIAARLHAIGNQARQEIKEEPFKPFVLVCAHAGIKTGEDGPTHADPQPLQLLQENFPLGTVITLTPWDASEVWPLFATALERRPAVVAPFVTRPNETVLDRSALGLAPAEDAVTGLYALRRANGKGEGTLPEIHL